MTTAAILALLTAIAANLPAEEADGAALVAALKQLFGGLSNGTITPANFQAQVSALLASASAADAAVEGAGAPPSA